MTILQWSAVGPTVEIWGKMGSGVNRLHSCLLGWREGRPKIDETVRYDQSIAQLLLYLY